MNRLFRILKVALLLPFVWACQPMAQDIVDEAIAKHGGTAYQHLNVSFDFRDKHYVIQKDEGKYRYERHQADSSGAKIVDILTNDSFKRFINEKEVSVPDSMVQAYSNSVNSVVYFFLLPAPLNDPAVRKKLTGEVTIKNEPYYQIEVTFGEEGGGEDFQDRYLFWIHRERKTMDYLAYAYATNGGGVRFREAYNIRTIGGIRFCDYRNFGYDDLNTPLESLPEQFESGKLPLLSSIENKNIVVN